MAEWKVIPSCPLIVMLTHIESFTLLPSRTMVFTLKSTPVQMYRQFTDSLKHDCSIAVVCVEDLPIVAEISGSKVSFTNRSSKLQAENRIIMIVSSFKLPLPHKLSLIGIIRLCLWSQLMWKYCATGWAYYSSVFWQYLAIKNANYIHINQSNKKVFTDWFMAVYNHSTYWTNIYSTKYRFYVP